MKVEMDERGLLAVTPETKLESYALLSWCRDWHDHKTRLTVNIDQEGTAALDITAPEIVTCGPKKEGA